MREFDVFDNFYYNLKNVKSLFFLENEFFVDYPRVFMEKYGVDFPMYDKLKHKDANFNGFCVFSDKRDILPKGSLDHSFVYVQNGDVRFFQKSVGVCNRIQFFYDKNYHLRKDFIVNEYDFLYKGFDYIDLEEDALVNIFINKKLKEIPKTFEARRGNFSYGGNFVAGLDQFDSSVYYVLQGGFSSMNRLSLSFSENKNKKMFNFLNKNLDFLENIDDVVYNFKDKFVSLELFLNGDEGNIVRKKFGKVNFLDALYFMSDSSYTRF